MPEQLTLRELSNLDTLISKCEATISMVTMTPRLARALLDRYQRTADRQSAEHTDDRQQTLLELVK